MSRRDEVFCAMRDQLHRKTDRMFGKLLVAQWVFAIVLAFVISPFSYVGTERVLHFHVKLAIGFGALINTLPLALIYLRPGWWFTRQTIAVVQMLWSAVLIMITGGRIETHFHVFGSLAFLAFYRDWKMLPTATLVVAIDHLARGVWWPDSVYGTLNPEWWRFLEHAGWVVFEDAVLAYGCVRGMRELRSAAGREARLETMRAATECTVVERTKQLQSSVERYRSLVENTAAIPFEIDLATLKILYIAPQAARLFECTHDELVDGRFMWSLIHPDETSRVAEALASFASNERANTDAIDYRLVLRSGRVRYLRTLLSSRDGGCIRGITIDMTQQKRLEAELQQAQKLESVGRLAAGVAHEINTPIQFVSDSVQFVRDAMGELFTVVESQRAAVRSIVAGAPSAELAQTALSGERDADLPYLSAEVPQALERAIDGLDRVAVIVRSMRVFAHSSGEIGNVDLNRALSSTLVIARNEIKYVADVDLDLGELPLVRCHAGEINQVLLNVLLNAAHAVGEVKLHAQTRGKIAVRTFVEDGHAVIAIADTGPGIPDAIRDRVFDPFFTTKPVGKGTGQGLAIARSVIVEKHAGALDFQSIPGSGTTFFVRIPIGVAAISVRAA